MQFKPFTDGARGCDGGTLERMDKHTDPIPLHLHPEEAGTDAALEALTSHDVQEIHGLLRAGTPPAFRRELISLLSHPLFARTEGLTSEGATQLSYRRLRFLGARLNLRASELASQPEKLFALHDWAAFVDPTLCTLLSIHYSLCLGSIMYHGEGRRDLEEYVVELESLGSVGVFLATELGYGNNVVSLETEAVYDPRTQEFDLHTPTPQARKWMPNTAAPGVAKLAVVMARLVVGQQDHGVYPFIVRLSDECGPLPGVRIAPLGEKAGYHLDNGMTGFEHVRLPKQALLAGEFTRLEDDGTFHCAVRSRRKRFLDALDRVQAGRLNLSGAVASVAQGSAILALTYSQQRLTFAPKEKDVPVIRYRNQQRDVFGALSVAYGCTLAVQRTRRTWIGRTPATHDACMRKISVVKAVASYRAADSIARCRERCGAAGLFSENRFIPWWVATQGLITAEGDNQVVLLKSARQMAMSEGYALPELNPTLGPGERKLTDLALQRALFRLREVRKVEALRWGLQSGLMSKRRPFEVWNDHVNLAIETGEAHGVRLVFESFADGADSIEGPAGRRALHRLCALFGLREIERDLGWFVANGAVSSTEAKRLSHERDILCRDLLEVASALGDAMGVPKSVLSAPIRCDSYIDEYTRLAEERNQVRAEASVTGKIRRDAVA
ncbi:MAG: acyl-CoA dehydrogenase [Polyangiales bacterium]